MRMSRAHSTILCHEMRAHLPEMHKNGCASAKNAQEWVRVC